MPCCSLQFFPSNQGRLELQLHPREEEDMEKGALV